MVTPYCERISLWCQEAHLFRQVQISLPVRGLLGNCYIFLFIYFIFLFLLINPHKWLIHEYIYIYICITLSPLFLSSPAVKLSIYLLNFSSLSSSFLRISLTLFLFFPRVSLSPFLSLSLSLDSLSLFVFSLGFFLLPRILCVDTCVNISY